MNDNSIYNEYTKESKEILDKMRRSCESLKERLDKHTLSDILECSHKIKGVAGMMDYYHIEELAGEIESVSKNIVEGKLEAKPKVLSLLLEGVNLLAKYIETDFDERDLTLLEKLRKIGDV